MLSSVQKLSDNKFIKSQSEVIAFDEALALVPQVLSLEELKELFLVFEDHCLHHDVMWGLVHCVESFEAQHRLRAFVDIMPQLSKQAEDWAMVLLTRTLNNEGARKILELVLEDTNRVTYQETERLLKMLAQENEEPLASYASSLLHK